MPWRANLRESSGISENQGTIMVITWNENFRKLTTSDQSGAEIFKEKNMVSH